jgi:hypothetical protein
MMWLQADVELVTSCYDVMLPSGLDIPSHLKLPPPDPHPDDSSTSTGVPLDSG